MRAIDENEAASSNVNEQDIISLLQSSGLFERLVAIENSLRTHSVQEPESGSSSIKPLPQPTVKVELPSSSLTPCLSTTPYTDARDESFVCKGDFPVPAQPESLNARQFTTYRFGVFITNLLSNHNFPKTNILLASMLPEVKEQLENNYSSNAFKRSIFYDRQTSTLFVRIERLQTLGEFVLVIVHSLAHISTQSLQDDLDHRFIREFHRGLRLCCEELFTAHARHSNTHSDGPTLSQKDNAIVSYLDKMAPRNVALEVEQIKHRVHSFVEGGEANVLGAKLNALLDQNGPVVNVYSRMSEVSSDLKQLQQQAASHTIVVARRRSQHLKASAAVTRCDDVIARRQVVNAQLESCQRECTVITESIAKLKEKLSGGSDDASAWEELEKMEKAISAKVISPFFSLSFLN